MVKNNTINKTINDEMFYSSKTIANLKIFPYGLSCYPKIRKLFIKELKGKNKLGIKKLFINKNKFKLIVSGKNIKRYLKIN